MGRRPRGRGCRGEPNVSVSVGVRAVKVVAEASSWDNGPWECGRGMVRVGVEGSVLWAKRVVREE